MLSKLRIGIGIVITLVVLYLFFTISFFNNVKQRQQQEQQRHNGHDQSLQQQQHPSNSNDNFLTRIFSSIFSSTLSLFNYKQKSAISSSIHSSSSVIYSTLFNAMQKLTLATTCQRKHQAPSSLSSSSSTTTSSNAIVATYSLTDDDKISTVMKKDSNTHRLLSPPYKLCKYDDSTRVNNDGDSNDNNDDLYTSLFFKHTERSVHLKCNNKSKKEAATTSSDSIYKLVKELVNNEYTNMYQSFTTTDRKSESDSDTSNDDDAAPFQCLTENDLRINFIIPKHTLWYKGGPSTAITNYLSAFHLLGLVSNGNIYLNDYVDSSTNNKDDNSNIKYNYDWYDFNFIPFPLAEGIYASTLHNISLKASTFTEPLIVDKDMSSTTESTANSASAASSEQQQQVATSQQQQQYTKTRIEQTETHNSNFIFIAGPNFIPGDDSVQHMNIRRDVFHLAPSAWAREAWLARGWPIENVLEHPVPSPVDTISYNPNRCTCAVGSIDEGAASVKRLRIEVRRASENFIMKQLTQPQIANGKGIDDTVVSLLPTSQGSELQPKCIVYVKERGSSSAHSHKQEMLDILKRFGFASSCTVYTYGSYSASNFTAVGSCSMFAVVLDDTETQGLALQELMSMNVPLFVVGSRGRAVPSRVTPYFTAECGKTWHPTGNVGSLEQAFIEFLSKLDTYEPRKYVERELSFVPAVVKLLRSVCSKFHKEIKAKRQARRKYLMNMNK